MTDPVSVLEETTPAAVASQNDDIRSPWYDFFHTFLRHPMALVSGGFILLLVLVAIFAPWLAPFDPMTPDWMALGVGPTPEHWFGTDDLGRDVLSRIIYGARISLYVGIFSVTLGMIAGVLLGLLAGYYGRWLDMLIMRGSDVLFAFPGMLPPLPPPPPQAPSKPYTRQNRYKRARAIIASPVGRLHRIICRRLWRERSRWSARLAWEIKPRQGAAGGRRRILRTTPAGSTSTTTSANRPPPAGT